MLGVTVLTVTTLMLGCHSNSSPAAQPASSSPASIVFATDVPLPSAPASDTAEQLEPVYIANTSPAATSAPGPTGFPTGGHAHVRTLRYAGDFIAASAFEGADGEFYLTYFWDMGSTPYQADRLGVIDGSAIREIFAGVFLDEVTIVGGYDGYPEFQIDPGGTAHMSSNYGTWRVSGAGVRMVQRSQSGYYSPPIRPCSWCNVRQMQRTPGYCSPFSGGRLCDTNGGVTFVKNGVTSVIDEDGYLVGAGPHRFLIIERPSAEPPVYLEGFADSD